VAAKNINITNFERNIGRRIWKFSSCPWRWCYPF